MNKVCAEVAVKLAQKNSSSWLFSVGFHKIYHSAFLEKVIPKKKITSFVKNLKSNLESGKGLLISGPIGVGKTSILCCLAKETYKMGKLEGYYLDSKKENFVPMNWVCDYRVVYTSTTNLFNSVFKEGNFMERCSQVDLLLLDDFGREYINKYPLSRFEEMIELRYANMKSTVIATGLSFKMLENNINYKRIIDRWKDERFFEWIEIKGESKRKKAG